VLIEEERIKWIGKMEDLSMGRMKDTEVLDCHEKVVLPGFVDSHTHLLFSGSREDEFAMRSAGATYQEIAADGGGILSTVRHTRESSKKDLKKSARRRLSAMMSHGTTTVEIKSGYGLDMDAEMKMLEAINELNAEEVMTIVPTFLGAHAIPPEHRDERSAYIREIVDTMIRTSDLKSWPCFAMYSANGVYGVEESREIWSREEVRTPAQASCGGACSFRRCGAGGRGRGCFGRPSGACH
jgi:imidazolonepropionase